jgi:4-amino-4-deoxy-L-arabinose transferase-like glycosyltransferase
MTNPLPLKNEKHALLFLLGLASLLMLSFLGSAELWTQEGRWGEICWNMLIRKDFFHPYCYGAPYYDKPLLTYWLPLLVTTITGFFNEWTLRLPSALLGIGSVYAMYRLGSRLQDKTTGLIAAALLCSTFLGARCKR